MDLSAQQRVFSLWLDAAEGKVPVVEQALIMARDQNAGKAPTSSQVLSKIREINRTQARQTKTAVFTRAAR